MAVVDASVVTAAFIPTDKFHQVSTAWLAQAAKIGEKFVAPAIILAEVGASIRRGADNVALAQEAISIISEDTIIEILPITVEFSQRAATIAIDKRIRGCDAFYVALAVELNEDLVSLDKQQIERSQGLIRAYQPFVAG